jgi:hypothetical protein
MKATTTSALLNILCDGRPVDPARATVRIMVTHMDSGSAVRGLVIALRWLKAVQVDTSNPTNWLQLNQTIQSGQHVDGKLNGLQSITDQSGAVTFCGVPADQSLELLMPRSDDDPEFVPGQRAVRITSFIVRRGQLVSRTVSVRPPK